MFDPLRKMCAVCEKGLMMRDTVPKSADVHDTPVDEASLRLVRKARRKYGVHKECSRGLAVSFAQKPNISSATIFPRS